MKKFSLISISLILVIILSVIVGQAQRTIPTASQFVERISPVLEEAGCPLTDEQLAKIAEIPSERGVFKAVMEVLTDEQKSALKTNSSPHREGGRRGVRHRRAQHLYRDLICRCLGPSSRAQAPPSPSPSPPGGRGLLVRIACG